MVAAPVVVLGDDGQPTATAVTDEQTREQMGGCGASSREQMLSGLQSALDGLPGLVVDDSQSLDHTRFPLDSGSPPVDASPGLRTLSPFPAIEVELAHILGVLQHEIDRVRAPRAPRIVQVKVFCDGFLPQAITEQLEDLAHDDGFRWLKHDAVGDTQAVEGHPCPPLQIAAQRQ